MSGKRALLPFLGALALLAAPATLAQNARLYVLADSVSLGERFEVAVAVDHPAGRSVQFEAVPAGDPETTPLLTAGDAEAFSMRRLAPTVRGPVRTDSAVYEVAVFAVDHARVGPFSVRLTTGSDTMRIDTPSRVVPVRSELSGDSREPAPLGPPEPFPSALPVWIALGVLALAAVGLLIWALRRVMTKPSVRVPRQAPYPEAIAHLDALDAAPAVTAETVEEHTVEIRNVVRAYLGRRLGVPALEETTEELMARLATDRRVTDEGRASVLDVLRLTDLVAFAGYRPDPEAAAEVRRRARGAVDDVERSVGAEEEARRIAAAALPVNPEPGPAVQDAS